MTRLTRILVSLQQKLRLAVPLPKLYSSILGSGHDPLPVWCDPDRQYVVLKPSQHRWKKLDVRDPPCVRPASAAIRPAPSVMDVPVVPSLRQAASASGPTLSGSCPAIPTRGNFHRARTQRCIRNPCARATFPPVGPSWYPTRGQWYQDFPRRRVSNRARLKARSAKFYLDARAYSRATDVIPASIGPASPKTTSSILRSNTQ